MLPTEGSDPASPLFVDRNSKTFAVVLDQLREPETPLPSLNPGQHDRLMRDFAFYGFDVEAGLDLSDPDARQKRAALLAPETLGISGSVGMRCLCRRSAIKLDCCKSPTSTFHQRMQLFHTGATALQIVIPVSPVAKGGEFVVVPLGTGWFTMEKLFLVGRHSLADLSRYLLQIDCQREMGLVSENSRKGQSLEVSVPLDLAILLSQTRRHASEIAQSSFFPSYEIDFGKMVTGCYPMVIGRGIRMRVIDTKAPPLEEEEDKPFAGSERARQFGAEKDASNVELRFHASLWTIPDTTERQRLSFVEEDERLFREIAPNRAGAASVDFFLNNSQFAAAAHEFNKTAMESDKDTSTRHAGATFELHGGFTEMIVWRTHRIATRASLCFDGKNYSDVRDLVAPFPKEDEDDGNDGNAGPMRIRITRGRVDQAVPNHGVHYSLDRQSFQSIERSKHGLPELPDGWGVMAFCTSAKQVNSGDVRLCQGWNLVLEFGDETSPNVHPGDDRAFQVLRQQVVKRVFDQSCRTSAPREGDNTDQPFDGLWF